uniref:Uncharacterized protein n=1 Tax=Oryza nivara TaxID=4536 RepID=A0A0E0FUQ8_ORYNI
METEGLRNGYIASSNILKSNVDMKGVPDPKFIRQTDMLASGATVITSFQTVSSGFQFVKFTFVQKLTPMWSSKINGKPFSDDLFPS